MQKSSTVAEFLRHFWNAVLGNCCLMLTCLSWGIACSRSCFYCESAPFQPSMCRPWQFFHQCNRILDKWLLLILLSKLLLIWTLQNSGQSMPVHVSHTMFLHASCLPVCFSSGSDGRYDFDVTQIQQIQICLSELSMGPLSETSRPRFRNRHIARCWTTWSSSITGNVRGTHIGTHRNAEKHG